MSSGTRQGLEFTQYISPDGAVYNFETGSRFIMTEEGLGMPEIKYITQKGPMQVGETYLGYTLEPRVIQYTYRVNGCSRDAYWANRSALLNAIRPNRQTIGSFKPGQLRKTLSNGQVRDLDVFVLEGPKFGPRDLNQWDEWGFTETLRFIAPDPTFYNPTVTTATLTYQTADHLIFYNSVTGTTATGLTFHRKGYADSSGMQFTSGLIDASINLTTLGSWLVYPAITINGPANGLSVHNTTTGEMLRINYVLQTGQTIKIHLPYGNKRMYIQQTGENIIGTLSSDSDLATFHLEPNPGASGGVNVIKVFANFVEQGTSSFSFEWNDRYIGQ